MTGRTPGGRAGCTAARPADATAKRQPRPLSLNCQCRRCCHARQTSRRVRFAGYKRGTTPPRQEPRNGVRECVERHHAIGAAGSTAGARHAVDDARRFVLREGGAAGRLIARMPSAPSLPMPVITTPSDAAAEDLRGRAHRDVGRRAAAVDLGPSVSTQRAVGRRTRGAVAGRDQRQAGSGRSPSSGLAHADSARMRRAARRARAVKPAGMCCTTMTASEVSPGKRGESSAERGRARRSRSPTTHNRGPTDADGARRGDARAAARGRAARAASASAPRVRARRRELLRVSAVGDLRRARPRPRPPAWSTKSTAPAASASNVSFAPCGCAPRT